MKQTESPQVRPLLASLAIVRTDSAELPGRYCSEQDVWVIDGPIGPTPIIVAATTEAFIPVTKVQGERDNFATSALLEISTKTSQQLERDDTHTANSAGLLDLHTKTRISGEQDDAGSFRYPYLLELYTKTETTRERDDK